MQSVRLLTVLLLTVLPAFGQATEHDAYTPLIAAPLTAKTWSFHGTDDKYHVDYELVVSNTSPTPATLQKVEVLDAGKQNAVVQTYSGADLHPRLRLLSNTPAESAVIGSSETRLLLIDLAFSSQSDVPEKLEHRFELLGAALPSSKAGEPVPLTYVVAPLSVGVRVPHIGPPLAGKHWVALNVCCEVEQGVHRTSSLACNGKIYYAQRFAIDWMRLNSAGRLVGNDPDDIHNYAAYGADVLAVADGTVVETLSTLKDQKPGELPDPKTINIGNVDGNHVVLDLGNGVFAFYAHMQINSLTVQVGQRVHRGQVLGKLGNTGNTSAPHLHFHLMDGPSVLGSNGIPYVVDSFATAGQIPEEVLAAAKGIEGDYSKGIAPVASPRHDEFPMNLSIIDFSDAPVAAASSR